MRAVMEEDLKMLFGARLDSDELARIVAGATAGLPNARREFGARTLVVVTRSPTETWRVVRPLRADETCLPGAVQNAARQEMLAHVADAHRDALADVTWIVEDVRDRGGWRATQARTGLAVRHISVVALLMPDIVWAHAFPLTAGELAAIYEAQGADGILGEGELRMFCCSDNVAHHTAPIEAAWRARAMARTGTSGIESNVALLVDVSRDSDVGLGRASARIEQTVGRKKERVTTYRFRWRARHATSDDLYHLEGYAPVGTERAPPDYDVEDIENEPDGE